MYIVVFIDYRYVLRWARRTMVVGVGSRRGRSLSSSSSSSSFFLVDAFLLVLLLVQP